MRCCCKSRTYRAGQKIQLKADIYPLPPCPFHYKWEVVQGQKIAKVDDKGVLTISPKAVAGNVFTIKTTAITEDPYIRPKATVVDYIIQ